MQNEKFLDATARSLDVAGSSAYLKRRKTKREEAQMADMMAKADRIEDENEDMERSVGHVKLVRAVMEMEKARTSKKRKK